MAHQYIEQMEEEVRAAVFGNVGTMIVFRVGAYDAEVLEKEFAPQFTAEDIVNLGFTQIYLKLMIDGISSQPFSATTLGPIALPETSSSQEAIRMSREQFAHTRADVERAIAEWHEPIVAPPKTKPTPGPGGAVYHPPKSQPQPQSHMQSYAQPHAPSQPHAPAPTSNSAPHAPVAASVQPTTQHAAPQPVPPAQTTTHKPFATQLASVVQGSGAKPGTQAAPHATHSVPLAQSTPHVQPVPLSNLAQKPHKVAPKEATPERVNELRNALASVLAAQKKPVEKSRPAPQAQHEEKVQEKKPPQESRREEQRQEPRQSSGEVSEDLLKSVLKID